MTSTAHPVRPAPQPAVPAPFSRRALLVVTGLSAAAIGGLTACGLQEPAADGAPGPQTASTGDVPVGGGRIYPASETVITQPTAGQFQAFSSICTHAGCPVTEVTDSIGCLCHGSRFSLADGSVLSGPAPEPLPAKTVTVSGTTVSVAG
ncbi:Ferredoxin subunit of nitrite reductase or a ring-hydroxylating dioxygenase [Friedmanniella luteola]|uniref:Cytochrome bc1 complex Rieske iron-sulfur subunit n=1 Tax=Friedmanniella luteola TaxID=546871 RepID=A0A1H1L1D3_9ACTN|nr:Rieske (2Fe-2S) protein [Friedmanniella luteola]SDR68336.1 Ferredoxin subunit of nitrite reductase or a ring-hydroxylating dioxygenase [Friedmanniella luteola]